MLVSQQNKATRQSVLPAAAVTSSNSSTRYMTKKKKGTSIAAPGGESAISYYNAQ